MNLEDAEDMPKCNLFFDYTKMTRYGFVRCKKNKSDNEAVFIGAVHVGNIRIDVLYYFAQKKFFFDYYVFNEDTGYGYCEINDCEIPYDYAGRNSMDYVEEYADFIEQAEPLFVEFILKSSYVGKSTNKTLSDHAENALLIW